MLGRAVRQIDECTLAPSGNSQGASWMGLWVTPQRVGGGTRHPSLLRKKIGSGLYELERGLQTAFGSFMRRGEQCPLSDLEKCAMKDRTCGSEDQRMTQKYRRGELSWGPSLQQHSTALLVDHRQ